MTQPNLIKVARTDHPIHPLLAERYSPYAFDPRPIDKAKLASCFEAARWAASSYNEQPWTFIVATRDDDAEWPRILGCLVEANQAWAKFASALVLTVVSRTFSRNGKPNRVAEHDIGLAAGNLVAQATHLGLHVHQMAGINHAVARQTYNIPEGHDPYTAIAIGYAADPDKIANQEAADRDRAPRHRKPLPQIVFSGTWGQSAGL